MTLRAVQFAALVLTALAMVPAGAHFFEMPNKIGLARDQYFTVQQIYQGWILFGIVLFPAVAANIVLAIMLRGRGVQFWLAALAAFCMVAGLAIFFTWTYPANVETSNWTVAPLNWDTLRAQWEYSHAANAVMTFIALCSLVLSALMVRE